MKKKRIPNLGLPALTNQFTPLFITIIFLFLFFFGGCGFKLNRQQAQLPKGDNLLAFGRLTNSTYLPGADLRLRQNIGKKFGGEKGIRVVPQGAAEQILSIQIIKNNMEKKEYSKNIAGLVEYIFSVTASVDLIETKNQNHLFNGLIVTGNFVLKKNQDIEPDEFEKKQGFEKALDSVAKNIFTRLTQDF